jgi:hypothetical protein
MSAEEAGGRATPLRRPTTPQPNKRPVEFRKSEDHHRPVHPFAPFRNQRTFLSAISPAEIDTGVCGRLQVDLVCNGEQAGDAMENAHRSAVPLASLRSARFYRPLLGLFKSTSGTLGRRDGQNETHFVRLEAEG